VLALMLARRAIRIRIIDDNEAPGAHSRAMVVPARTLEFYRQFGFAEDVIAAGIKVESARVREARTNGSVEVRHLRFEDIGRGLSPYPFALAYPQDDHERFLVTRLHEAGGEVQWSTRLTGFTQDSGVDNFAPFQSFDWQLHVYGTPTAGLNDACQRLNLPLQMFAWNEPAERAGFKKDAFYVVRADGYVGLASATQAVAALNTYLRSRGVRV
jgi:hypothetical protein